MDEVVTLIYLVGIFVSMVIDAYHQRYYDPLDALFKGFFWPLILLARLPLLVANWIKTVERKYRD